MGNYVILALVALGLGFGIFYTIKHFKGDGGCCGGGNYKPKRKRLKKVLYKKCFKVDGMHCESCKGRVEEVVNGIVGVSGAVDLKKGILTVSYESDVGDEVIIARIIRAGYKASVI